MMKKSYFSGLRKDLHAYQTMRREIIKQSGDALHHAKRAIFAIHREERSEALEHLDKTEMILKALLKQYKKTPALFSEGSYKEALEEYVEAYLFLCFVSGKAMGQLSTFEVPSEVYLAGLCDVPGELHRYAIRAATKRDYDLVERCGRVSEEIMTTLVEFNLTRYLRNKFDQAKQAARKLEQVRYEVSLSRKF